VIFLLVGFRPTRAERGAKVRQASIVAVAGLLLVAAPLALTTYNIARERSLRAEIGKVLGQLDAEIFGLSHYSIQKEQGQFVVTGTVYAYQEIRPESVEMVQRRLADAVGVPVELRVTIVPATLTVVGDSSRKESAAAAKVVPSVEIDDTGEPAAEKATEVRPAESAGH
jgi:hypothetical protein